MPIPTAKEAALMSKCSYYLDLMAEKINSAARDGWFNCTIPLESKDLRHLQDLTSILESLGYKTSYNSFEGPNGGHFLNISWVNP